MEHSEEKGASSDREFAFMIIERMERNLGVPLRHIFESEASADAVRSQVRSAIVAAVEKKAAAELASEDWPNAGQKAPMAALAAGDDVNLVPAIAVTAHNLQVLSGYTGNEIHDYVKRVTNGLSLIHEGQTAGEVALEILRSGLGSFSIAMIAGTAKALLAGQSLRVAVTLGVRAMGSISVVVGVAAFLVSELLLYLLQTNKKVFLGMVFNNTDLNLQVKDWPLGVEGDASGDLYMESGRMVAFMETHENEQLESPLVQVPARFIIAKDDPDNLVMGGIFAAEKKFGFVGTDGIMALTDLHNADPRFFLLFACPYSRDNGVNVAIDATGSRTPKEAFDGLFDERGLDRTASSGIYSFQARCNSESGGEAAGIAILQTLMS